MGIVLTRVSFPIASRMKLFLKYVILITTLLLVCGKYSVASHMIGGDITYKCLGDNVYEITLTLYQDCLFGEPLAIAQDDPAYLTIFTSGPGPSQVFQQTVGSMSSGNIDPNFSNECITNYPNTCLRRQIFRRNVTLAPNSNGYDVVYQRCCRNASINNVVNPGNVGVSYTAHIPGFDSTECRNNSATFNTMPPQIICANNPFIYDFSATDIDGDSLTYELCAAKPGASTVNPIPPNNGPVTPPPYGMVPYMPPYSATMPMSGMPALQINAQTGLMTATPNAIGRFVVTVCANEWKEGVLVNTLSRDVQFVVTNCSRAVYASIPELSGQPGVYAIECDDFTVQFANTSSGGETYLWNFGVGGATSTAFEPTFTYPDTGTYEVKLIVNPGTTCTDSITTLVKVYPTFHADFTWEGMLCPEQPIHFIDQSEGTYGDAISWQWNFGDDSTSVASDPTHIYARPGGQQEVTLITKNALGCTDTAAKILPLQTFDPNAGNDTIIVIGSPFNLQGSGCEYYLWEPPDYLSNNQIANPITTFPNTGNYTYVLHGSNEEGCMATDTVHIQVVKDGIIFVPNAFSPNGDGVNDFLIPRIVGYTQINSFAIFNRWGEKVYATTNDNEPAWDGRYNSKAAEVGTYFWHANAIDRNGVEVEAKGDIILLR